MPDYFQMRQDKENELSGQASFCGECSQHGTIGGNLHVALNVTIGPGGELGRHFYIRCEDLAACHARATATASN